MILPMIDCSVHFSFLSFGYTFSFVCYNFFPKLVCWKGYLICTCIRGAYSEWKLIENIEEKKVKYD